MPTAAYSLAAWLTVVLLVVAAGGLLLPELYRDPDGWAAQARGINLVDVVVTVPTLIASMALSARGSLRAHIVWVGALGYVLYNAVIFAFEVAFNRLFLLYVGLLSLAVFALIANLRGLGIPRLTPRFSGRTPVRSVSAYLMLVAALFLLAWMSEIVPALVANTTPTNIAAAKLPTNPVYVLDLAFLIPLYVLAAIWLLDRRAWGYVLAGVHLVLNTLLSVSIISSTLFQYASDRSVSLAVIPLFGIIALVSVALAMRYLGAVQAQSASNGSRLSQA
jgi:hypothetical protein